MNKSYNIDYDLDEEEKEIERAFAKGKFKRVPNFKNEMKKYRAAARATLAKTKNINIRISQGDLFKVKSHAGKQGIPYQTLLSSLIHQFSNEQIEYNVLREPKKDYSQN